MGVTVIEIFIISDLEHLVSTLSMWASDVISFYRE